MTLDNEAWLAAAPAGWTKLVTELDTKLRTYWPKYTIEQVKEKFGTLRFYADPGVTWPEVADDEDGQREYEAWYSANITAFEDLICEYENASSRICQNCGKPGNLGDKAGWWATYCPECAPVGWVSADVVCEHPHIENGTCTVCGRERVAQLEHSDIVLSNTHPVGTCWGQWCTIHNRSNHPLRSFRQEWRADKYAMERVCEHGVGHPDPDEVNVDTVHGCDGCCTQAASADTPSVTDKETK